MKVLHVIPSISPLRGGPSQAVIEMVRALRYEGVDACIVSTVDNGIYKDPELPTNTWFEYMGVPLLLHKCLDSRVKVIREFIISPSLIRWLAKEIHAYDIVHFHAIFSFTTTFGMLLARKKEVRYIVRTIGQLNPWSLRQGLVKKRLMMALIERGNLTNAAAIHVTSGYELKDIELLRIDNTCINLGVGVNVPCNSPRKIEDVDVLSRRVEFLFLSRIHPKKQLELLLDSLTILKNDRLQHNWGLTIAGSGEEAYVHYLKQKASNYGIAKHLTWKGHVRGDDKTKILGMCDWFVLLSASENFGISVVEAMAASLPVIITENVGIAEKVVEYNAGFVCQEDSLQIAQLFHTILLQVDNRTMGCAARRLVEENYSWSYIGKTLCGYYLNLPSKF